MLGRSSYAYVNLPLGSSVRVVRPETNNHPPRHIRSNIVVAISFLLLCTRSRAHNARGESRPTTYEQIRPRSHVPRRNTHISVGVRYKHSLIPGALGTLYRLAIYAVSHILYEVSISPESNACMCCECNACLNYPTHACHRPYSHSHVFASMNRSLPCPESIRV